MRLHIYIHQRFRGNWNFTSALLERSILTPYCFLHTVHYVPPTQCCTGIASYVDDQRKLRADPGYGSRLFRVCVECVWGDAYSTSRTPVSGRSRATPARASQRLEETSQQRQLSKELTTTNLPAGGRARGPSLHLTLAFCCYGAQFNASETHQQKLESPTVRTCQGDVSLCRGQAVSAPVRHSDCRFRSRRASSLARVAVVSAD